MAVIANVALTNTFDTWRTRTNVGFTRQNAFAINESSLYANTLTANVAFTSKGLATFDGRAAIGTNLSVAGNTTLGAANKNITSTGTWSHTGRATISTNLTVSGNTTLGAASKTITSTGLLAHTGRATISTNLTVTGNTALGAGLLANNSYGTAGHILKTSGTGVYWGPVAAAASTSQYLQVANAVATYQTKTVERAALANTNAYIGAQATRITLVNTNLLNTNTAIRALDTAKLSVANAVAIYATKSNPTTSGLLAHTGRATISTNLAVTGNTTVSGVSTFTGAATFNGAVTLGDGSTDLTTINGRAVINQNLRVTGNTVLGGTTKTIATIGVLTHTGAVIVTGNTSLGAGLLANSSYGAAGNVLKSSGTGVYWGPVAAASSTTQYLQVANAVATYATKMNPTTSGLLAHTGRATISTNLTISGNTTLSGTTTDNSNALSQTLTDAATILWDVASGRVATVTIGASRNVGAPSNLKIGTYILSVIQGGTGSYTLTWNAVFKWTGAVAPVLSTAVGRRDLFTFYSDGTNLYGSYLPDVR